MLISTIPDTEGKAAAIFRSRQLTDFPWTPVCDIPTFLRNVGKTKLAAGQELTGMIYSSTEPTDKFITENISFETLMTILANPDSALYQMDLKGHNNSWPYFGIVCNGLVRYAFHIRRRYSTKRRPTVPGIRKIADAGCYTADQIELCDVLYAFGQGRNHVSLITDILRDETGQIRQIEVSEAVRPTCAHRQYDLDVFYEKYRLFALWRYDFVDSVPMPDAQQHAILQRGVPPLPAIAVNYGNKTNYRTYENVVISVFSEGRNEIEICRGDEVIENVSLEGKAKISRRFDRGYYTARHIQTGEYVEFCVTDPQISHVSKDGTLQIHADSCDPQSRILYMEFRQLSKNSQAQTPENDHENNTVAYYSPATTPLVKVEELTEEEKETGIIQRAIPQDAWHFKIYFENQYGIWTHTMIRI